MDTWICDHFSIFIKIIQPVVCCFVHHQLIHITYLWRGAEFSQIVYHITAVKRNFLTAAVFCRSLQIGDLDHMRVSRCKFTAFVVIIISIKNRSVDLKMIKIIHCRSIFFGSIFIQAVKAIAFQNIFPVFTGNWKYLGLLRNRTKASLCRLLHCCRKNRLCEHHCAQTKCQCFIYFFSSHILLSLFL